MAAKILFLDIETTPLKAWSWGPKWKTSLIQMVEDSYTLCMGYRWGRDGVTDMLALPDYKGYEKRRDDDRKLIKDIHKLMSEADMIVAHNGDKFDIAKIYSRMLRHGMTRPTPFATVDTKKVSQRVFGEPSNSLADLAAALKLGSKTPHSGFELWIGCMEGDPEAWAKMTEYCANDVDLLVGVYEAFLMGGWINNHPNLSVFEDTAGCPHCGADESKLVRRGIRATDVNRYVQYRCKVCGSYSRSRFVEAKAPHERRRAF